MLRKVRCYLWIVTSICLVGYLCLLKWVDKESHQEQKSMLMEKFGDLLNSVNKDIITQAALRLNSIQTESSLNGQAKVTNVEGGKVPKVYIYSLHPKFNRYIKECLSKRISSSAYKSCFQTNNHGFGGLLYQDGELGVYNTHQFSLEIILHHQLLNSKYRTMNPATADIFYIPAYLGLTTLCKETNLSMLRLQSELFQTIRLFPYFDQGRPHISAIAKIEREQKSLLQNALNRKVTYVAIEKETNRPWISYFGLGDQPIIVAPYPSYVHRAFTQRHRPAKAPRQRQRQRQVLLFLAAGTRRSNHFRGILLDQFTVQLSGISYADYLKRYHVSVPPQQLMLVTQECNPSHRNITVDWMQRSVFCLQPHGDSPTRKSFYDGIQSGCIPVIFKFAGERVEYPFQNVLNYTDFVVSVDAKRISRDNMTIFDIVKRIPDDVIHHLHGNVLKVAKKLQYSVRANAPNSSTFIDALDMIIQQVVQIYHL